MYSGMNRAKSDVIDAFFHDKSLNKVAFINDVDGDLYTINQIPEDKKYLKNFLWQEEKRPKNKFELFE